MPAKFLHEAACLQAAWLQRVLKTILAAMHGATTLEQAEQCKRQQHVAESLKTGSYSDSREGRFPNLHSSTALVPLQILLTPTKATDNGPLSTAQCLSSKSQRLKTLLSSHHGCSIYNSVGDASFTTVLIPSFPTPLRCSDVFPAPVRKQLACQALPSSSVCSFNKMERGAHLLCKNTPGRFIISLQRPAPKALQSPSCSGGLSSCFQSEALGKLESQCTGNASSPALLGTAGGGQ